MKNLIFHGVFGAVVAVSLTHMNYMMEMVQVLVDKRTFVEARSCRLAADLRSVR